MSSGATLTRRLRGSLVISAALLAAVSLARPAAAQITAGTAVAVGLTGRGVDSAHDPVNNRFLVVNGSFGPVRGVLVNSLGSPVSSPFTISSTGYANFVRVAYAADINGGNGGYLVVWSSEETSAINVRGRIVHANGTLGPENVIGTSAWLESAPAVAYSSTSKRFFVAWGGIPTIRGTTVDLNATPGSVVTLSSGYGRDPGVAWNPTRNEFGVSFNGETSTGVYSALAIVPANNPSGFTRNTFNVTPGGANYITDVDFDTATNRYTMVWWQGAAARSAQLDATGTLLADDVASYSFGSYDTLSVAYNAHTKTFLMGGSDPTTDDVRVAELDGRVRKGSTVTVSGVRALYTRVAGSRTEGKWMLTATNPPGNNPTWSVRAMPFSGTIVITIPAAPTLVSPSGTVASASRFSWNAVSGATWYYLWVNDSTGNKVKRWYTAAEAGCASGGTCSASPGVALANGDGHWWVQSYNSVGATWSAAKAFRLAQPPAAPALTSPKSIIYHSTPTFTWNAVSSATWYFLWVNDASGNRLRRWYSSEQVGCAAGTGSCTAAPGLQLTGGDGAWWVQSWEAVGGYGPWSAPAKFTIRGANPISATPTGAGVQFTWNAVPGATWYYLWVGGGPGGGYQQWYTAAQAECNASTCTVINSTALASGTWTWYILTWGDTWPGNKFGVWSLAASFVKP